MSERHVYTVTELTREIRQILESKFPQVWVEGEVSNLRIPTSGHFYFTLKDANCQLAAVMFRNVAAQVKFELKDGLKVICSGRISVYEKSGQYQIYVEELEPKGIGALQLAFEQLKERLSKEGLFAPAHKKPIPLLPQHIGIVTSPTGAAIRDILNILSRRFPNLHITINPVRVQGEGAALEIARAIDEFNALGGIDVLIVGRGGGSMEDLWAFNEEAVARAIYNSRIPVVSAVGHEIDFTIADFVADLRAPTPSAAAELVCAKKEEFVERVRALSEALGCALLDIVRGPAQRLDELTSKLGLNLKHFIEMSRERFKALLGKLEVLSPLAHLERGYSISLKLPKRTVLKDASALKNGDEVETRLARGGFVGVVKEIKLGGV